MDAAIDRLVRAFRSGVTAYETEVLIRDDEDAHSESLAKIDDSYSASVPGLEITRAFLRAQLFLAVGFDLAAYRELSTLEQAPLGLRVLKQEAIRRLLGNDLRKTSLGRRLANEIASLERGDD